MSSFVVTQSEEAMINQLKGFVDSNNLQGLVEFSNTVSRIPELPEDTHKKLVAATKAYTEHACGVFGNNASGESAGAIANMLINAGETLIRGTQEAAKIHGRFKVALLSCNVHAREMLSFVFETVGRVAEAAKMLQEMPLDASLPSHGNEYKFSLWVMIAELNLGIGQENVAESYLGHARPLEHAEGIHQGARDRFSYCYARVLDSSKKYVEAANRYFAVSANVDESQALASLRSSVVCATMAEPSPQRNRILGALYRDERRMKLGPIGEIVDKLFHQRVLRKHDIDALAPYLQMQHKAVGADRKTTEFDLAITRHNVLSATKIYTAITFTDLAALLGNTPAEAERIAAQMAAQGRISATIDQLNECVSFVGNAAVPVLRWDSQIDTVGNLVASIAETIVKRHPELEPKGGL